MAGVRQCDRHSCSPSCESHPKRTNEQFACRCNIVYLSGNTPLVGVLREALARDTVARAKAGGTRTTLKTARAAVRARIQHISDFLRDNLRASASPLPHEHAIVFDEAQRAWDAKHGEEKFDRPKSEPSLLLEIMGRHADWCACVCLVGGGQEIGCEKRGVVSAGSDCLLVPARDGSERTVSVKH